MTLKNKRILITAGSTWIPIDKVRIIGSIATGETGILLAKALQRLGAKVTLLLGATQYPGYCGLCNKIKLIRFKFFAELLNIMQRELKKGYDILIHSAAVSDYRPKTYYKHKIKSGIKEWKINFVPTPKLIDLVKKLKPSIFLVGFKFEPESSKDKLIVRARALIAHSKADLVVANTIYNGHYSAYIVSQKEVGAKLSSRNQLAKSLIKRFLKQSKNTEISD